MTMSGRLDIYSSNVQFDDKTTITVFRSVASVVLEIKLDAKPPEMSTGG